MFHPLLAAEPASDNRGVDSETLASCYHCGLPVPADLDPPVAEALGRSRIFCCHGCKAVCCAIIDAGLGDYYLHRTENAVSANERDIPGLLDHYDKPEIQRDYVLEDGDQCEASLLIDGIRCSACIWLNEKRLRSVNGVIEAHIDDTTHRARVRWNNDTASLSSIIGAIEDIGYNARPFDVELSRRQKRDRDRRSLERLVFAGVAGMMVMHFSLASYFMLDPVAQGEQPLWVSIGRWTSFLVSLTILAYPGQEFFVGAWRDISNRRVGMDVPISLGLSVALLGSLFTTIDGRGEVYYDSIAMFVFFLLLARRWEMQARTRAILQLDHLSHAPPRTAKRQMEDGSVEEVLSSELVPGDRVSVAAGETLSVDGLIIEGSSAFDESLITGEAIPVERVGGDRVMAGSVNLDQPVIVEVSHRANASTLSEIQRLIDKGLRCKPRYAVITDIVARWFVFSVLLIAGGTAVFWYEAGSQVWLHNTIAVLIVTCPCALALATPVSLAITAAKLVQSGVLPANMRALDTLTHCDTVVFDKTGTLTQGKPVITDVVSLQNMDKEFVISVAASLSSVCMHPLSHAFHQYTANIKPVTEASSLPGTGVCGDVAGTRWYFGKLQTSFECDEQCRHSIDDLVSQHRIVSVLVRQNTVQAIFGFRDPPREGISEVLTYLSAHGVDRSAILSGDRQRNVDVLAGSLGVETVLGGMTPQDKLAWIRQEQLSGHRVIMFGDGINDAPVLAVADVSVSYSDASDLANLNSDFVLLGDHFDSVHRVMDMAVATRRNIIQNMSWAVGYNLFAIPLAVSGMVSPWGAALGMSLSSALVVLNALRLQRR